MGAIDVKMMLDITNKAPSEASKQIPRVHELLKEFSTSRTIKDFFDSSRSDSRWESCLKTAKLYRSLLEQILEMSKEYLPGPVKTQSAPSIADEFPEAVQLVFLTRMMTELELRYSEFQLGLMTNPDAKQQELWRRLHEALQNDDRNYLEKLNVLLAKTGVSAQHFAAIVISDAQKTSPTAVTAVVEGMGIANPEGNIWRLAEIPGINPDFIQALECDRREMKHFFESGSNAAFIQLSNCRKQADGATILAFAVKSAERSKPADLAAGSQQNVGGLPEGPHTLRLPPGSLARGPLTPEKGADNRQGESQDSTFGTTYTAPPQTKIPSWWIECRCPDDHPNAGMVVNGVRWHAPVLQCPNPELRRLESK